MSAPYQIIFPSQTVVRFPRKWFMTQTYRIISETRSSYLLEEAGTEVAISKKLCKNQFYVGDFVTYDANGLKLLKRVNTVSKSSNVTVKNFNNQAKEQVMASNVDQIFILIALDQNCSLAKLERYYLVFYQEGIDLHLILSKKDLVPDYVHFVERVTDLYPQMQVLAISQDDGTSLEQVKKCLNPNSTGLLLGASGAGKSTLLNYLTGHKIAKVNQTRSDGKGKHTTTSSHLIKLPSLDYHLIDTPGFKGIDKVKKLDLAPLFSEILNLAKLCHFPNCQHDSEPKCAIKTALADGTLSQTLWQRYVYLKNKG